MPDIHYQTLLQLGHGHVIQLWPEEPKGKSEGGLLERVSRLVKKDSKVKTFFAFEHSCMTV